MEIGDDHEVVVIGAGPTGLMLAAELAIAGVDVLLVERRVDQHVDGSRAGGLLPRSLEVLDQRGVVDRFIDAGRTVPSHGFGGIAMDIDDLPTRHNHVLALRQRDFEPLLADWVLAELGVSIRRATTVVGVSQDDIAVTVDVHDGRRVRARYVVGCDGGRSVARDAAGIRSSGSDPTKSWLVAEVETDDDPEPGTRCTEAGLHGIGRIGVRGPVRVVLTEDALRTGDPTVDDLRAELVSVYGTDHGLSEVHWMSRFTDATRLADRYRHGRVLLAGDAAHTHPPQGGQGLNTGLQDAVNLGWKLAAVVQGRRDDDLLDTYDAERRPVAQRVLDNTLAQVVLTSGGDRHRAMRDCLTRLATVDEVRHRLMAELCALDIRYDIADASEPDPHPIVGRRMPDLDVDLAREHGASRVHELLHAARPILVDLTDTDPTGPDGAVDDPVRIVRARHAGPWRVPLLGDVDPAGAVLVRPDGHVAWAGDPTDPRLERAAHRWFGEAAGRHIANHRPSTAKEQSR